MISARALDLAVAQSVVTADQAKRLRAIETSLATTTARAAPPDDEAVRLVTGFADVFVTIGIALFDGALVFLLNTQAGTTTMLVALAVTSWLLAELFTRRRAMALPSIALLLVFLGSIFALALLHLIPTLADPPSLDPLFAFTAPQVRAVDSAALITIAMAIIHYRRFRVPITIAAIAATLAVMLMVSVAGIMQTVDATTFNVVLFACGIAIFCGAMAYDMSDPARATRRSDIAFWLHLLAAPLIVHSSIQGFLHGFDEALTPASAVSILCVFFALGIVAVIIDRRALLVSGLVYAGISFATLIKTFGALNTTLLMPTVMLVLGCFILLVSAGWQKLRRALLRRLPRRLSSRLPHPLVSNHP